MANKMCASLSLVFLVFLKLLFFSSPLATEINVPRSELGAKWMTGSKANADIHKRLKSLGHQIKYSSFSSGVAIIKWDKGSWHGAADPRREGKAVSLQVEKNP